ncbi:MAG: inovirus-type Gp2 protein [Colwellia sp.]|nr:inovirus-type Gp2 protein [Colwellia sp.]
MFQPLTNPDLHRYQFPGYEQYPVITSQGDLVKEYLDYSLFTLKNAFREHQNTCALRLTLKVPWQVKAGSDYTIQAFLTNLEQQIAADLTQRNELSGKPLFSRLRHLWSKEFDRAAKPYYSVFLLFNLDAYNCIECDILNVGGSMLKRIHQAWSSALDIEPFKVNRLIHVPDKPFYHIAFKNGHFGLHPDKFSDLFFRVSYFARMKNKVFLPDYSPFGYSRS